MEYKKGELQKMKLRNRKILSLFITAAMIFGMNTSVLGSEVSNNTDLINGLAAVGWSVENGSETEFTSFDRNTKTLRIASDNNIELHGKTNSSSITIESVTTFDQHGDFEDSGMAMVRVKPGTAGSSTKIKLISNNELAEVWAKHGDPDSDGGYQWFIKNYGDFDGFEDWLEYEREENGKGISINVDLSKAYILNNGYVTITYSNNTPDNSGDTALMEQNKPAGETIVALTEGTMKYYSKAPYFGGKLDKTNFRNIIGNVTVSQGDITYTLEKATLKYEKGSKKAILKASKISGGNDKKAQKAVKKAINDKKIKIDIYPFHLDATSSIEKGKLTGKVSKDNLKFSGTIPGGGKFNLKNGKQVAKIGGTASVTLSGNSVYITSDAITGSIGTDKINNKSK